MSNNYELPPTPPSGGSGAVPSAIDQLILSLKETNPISTITAEDDFKLCPFRKITIFMDCDAKDSWPTLLNSAYYTEEDFLPCLKERCMMYRNNKMCGLKRYE